MLNELKSCRRIDNLQRIPHDVERRYARDEKTTRRTGIKNADGKPNIDVLNIYTIQGYVVRTIYTPSVMESRSMPSYHYDRVVRASSYQSYPLACSFRCELSLFLSIWIWKYTCILCVVCITLSTCIWCIIRIIICFNFYLAYHDFFNVFIAYYFVLMFILRIILF